MALKDDLVAAFPEFASEADARLDYWIAQAVLQVNATVFGAKADHATLLLSAHFLAMSSSSRSGNGGAITSEKVGDISVNYGASGSQDDHYSQTSYGQLFSALRRQVPKTPLLV